MNHCVGGGFLCQNVLLRNYLQECLPLMTLAKLRRQNPELFDQVSYSWYEGCHFFNHEYVLDIEEGYRSERLKAVFLAMVMRYKIQHNLDCELLRGSYFRTNSKISYRAMVVLRCTPSRKIQIESWVKDDQHRLLADWQGS
jgi:hypothetical protein